MDAHAPLALDLSESCAKCRRLLLRALAKKLDVEQGIILIEGEEKAVIFLRPKQSRNGANHYTGENCVRG